MVLRSDCWRLVVSVMFVMIELDLRMLIVSAPFVETELDLGLFLNCVLRVVRMFQKSGGQASRLCICLEFSECPGFELPECISDKNVSEVWGSRFQNVHLIGFFRMSGVRASGMYI